MKLAQDYTDEGGRLGQEEQTEKRQLGMKTETSFLYILVL